MTTFASAFREIVAPALRQRCRSAGFCIGRGRWSFTQGHAFVLDLARQRGAMHLPDRILEELDNWIATQIVAAVIEMEDELKRSAYASEIADRALANAR